MTLQAERKRKVARREMPDSCNSCRERKTDVTISGMHISMWIFKTSFKKIHLDDQEEC